MSPVESEDGFGIGRGRAGRGDVGQRLTRWIVGSPGSVWAIVILASLGLVLAGVSIFMSRQVLASPGQVMDHTRVARVAISVPDPVATSASQKLARDKAPKVFVGDEALIEQIAADVRSLPQIAAASQSFEETPAEVRDRFSLTSESWAAARSQWMDGKPSESWKRRCDKLAELLRARPIVDGGRS